MFRRLLTFEGRSRRIEWWAVNIAAAVLGGTIARAGALVLTAGHPAAVSAISGVSASIVALNAAVTLAAAWLQLAVGVRRNHDRGQSGVGLILYVGMGTLGSLLILGTGLTHLQMPFIPGAGFLFLGVAICYLVVGLYWFVVLGFLPGEPTANAYGTPHPLRSSVPGSRQA